MAIVQKIPSQWSEATIDAIAVRVKPKVFKDQANIWGYVDEYADLPLTNTDSDPEVGDLVGVLTTTGTWLLGTQRREGFYRRKALTGTVSEQYGTTPDAAFVPWEQEIENLKKLTYAGL
jgi:hypothetical protein